MKANDGKSLNPVSAQAIYSAVVQTVQDRTLVHRRYFHTNVGTHLQLSILRRIGVNEVD